MLDVAAIPDAVGYYLAGFTDGEGSFNVSFRPRSDYVFPWKVSLCFNVSQRERAILEILQAHLGCGTMRQRADGVWYFEVNNLADLIQNVIPFFEHFGFLSSKKRRDFAKFVELASILRVGQHLTREGVVEVLRIRLDMNDGWQAALSGCADSAAIRESSETIRQTPENSGDDMVRSAWRHAEHDRDGRAPAPRMRAGVTTMNGPKVSAFVALVKFGYMLENPSILRYSPSIGGQ